MQTDQVELTFIPNINFAEHSDPVQSDYFVALGYLLGRCVNGPEDLVRATFEGLEPTAVKNLIGFSQGAIKMPWIIPVRTLSHRIDHQQHLTSDESGKFIRFCKVMVHSTRVFGDKEKALRWLTRTHPHLSTEYSALELCQSEEGALLVQNALNAIDHGFFA